jgi:hypothetical protein
MQRWVIVFCLCLVAGFGIWFVVLPDSVSAALSKQIRRGPGPTVDFAEVAPFAWERVYVFGPYTPHDQIHTSLGFHWSEVGRTTIDSNEGVNLVVFVHDGKVVHWFEHARHEELEGLANSDGYAREDAKFVVCRVGPEQRLALVPPKR